MIDVEYYYTSGSKWFIDFAASLSKATNEKVRVENNRLIFPSSLAEGRYELYELANNLSVVITDCVFFKELRLYRKAIIGNDHYKIFFNIGDAPVIVNKQSGRILNLSDSLAEAIVFSSHATEISFCPGVQKPMRTVQIIYHRSWAVEHLFENDYLSQLSRMQRYINYSPVQFTANFDLKSFELVSEMLSDKIPTSSRLHYLEGCTIQLIAIFFNNLIEESLGEEDLISNFAVRIIELKEKIETNLEEPTPNVTAAAKICLMSRTKFTSIFKILYNQSYAEYIQEIRMNRAVGLLTKGYTITDVGHKVGYSNIGHFAKVFKDYFGVVPKSYQRNM